MEGFRSSRSTSEMVESDMERDEFAGIGSGSETEGEDWGLEMDG